MSIQVLFYKNTYGGVIKLATNELSVRVKHATKTSSEWADSDPVLLKGEVAYSSDLNNRYKVGDGTSKWSALAYAKAEPVSHSHSATNITSGTLPVSRGGTGQTTGANAANALINALGTATSTPGDDDYFVSQYAGGGTTTTTYHRRPISALWEYIKTKISSVFGLTASSYSGNSSTATKLTSSAGSTTQPVYFSDGKPVATTYALNKTVPSNAVFTDTNTKMTQTVSTTDASYPLLLAPTGQTATTTTTGYFGTKLQANPSTGTLTATTFKGALSGNATSASTCSGNSATATKLATARTINGTSFNGSDNITTANWGTARNIYIADSDATNTGAAVSVNGSGNATLKLPATIKASLTGNSSTASKLATARTIALTGSVTGSGTFDGSGNLSIATTTNHTHSYLPLSGGTLTGNVITQGGSYVHHGTGTAGSAGYVQMAQLKITSNYQNEPIVIELARRNGNTSCVLNIMFSSADSTDPTLGSFTYMGTNYNCYMYKSATSTWLLYVQKSGGYDDPYVIRYHKPGYDSGITVTWTNVFASSLPSGATVATLGGSIKSASTATTLSGLTATVSELNYCDGVTSNIQTQLNGKLPTANVLNNVTTTASGYALDARQGKSLQDQITELKNSLTNPFVIVEGKTTAETISGYSAYVQRNVTIDIPSGYTYIGIVDAWTSSGHVFVTNRWQSSVTDTQVTVTIYGKNIITSDTSVYFLASVLCVKTGLVSS